VFKVKPSSQGRADTFLSLYSNNLIIRENIEAGIISVRVLMTHPLITWHRWHLFLILFEIPSF